ncbi:putative nepenthesin [Helianthus anomalus]
MPGLYGTIRVWVDNRVVVVGSMGGVKDFVVGWSIVSTRQPTDIAGFERGPASLPVQMGLKKFSYCLVSHQFEDAPVSSKMVLVWNSKNMDSSNSSGIAGVSYTKFRENPGSSSSAFKEYYYLSLRKITVGGKTVKIPYGFLVPDSMFESQVSKYKRAADVEDATGLRPCFNVSSKPVELPELMFHFKGGAKLALPAADYLSFLGDVDTLCMTIVISDRIGSGQKLRPLIIIGNYQQQNIYVEYDLKKGRLGFKKQQCK